MTEQTSIPRTSIPTSSIRGLRSRRPVCGGDPAQRALSGLHQGQRRGGVGGPDHAAHDELDVGDVVRAGVARRPGAGRRVRPRRVRPGPAGDPRRLLRLHLPEPVGPTGLRRPDARCQRRHHRRLLLRRWGGRRPALPARSPGRERGARGADRGDHRLVHGHRAAARARRRPRAGAGAEGEASRPLDPQRRRAVRVRPAASDDRAATADDRPHAHHRGQLDPDRADHRGGRPDRRPRPRRAGDRGPR